MSSGTAVDETLGSRVASNQFSIRQSTTNQYWDPVALQFNSATEKFTPLTFTSPNIWSSTRPTLSDTMQYTIRMQSTDLAGNAEPIINTVNIATFTYDISAPASRILAPTNLTSVPSLVTISGTVSDNTGLSGINTVELAVKVDTGM